MSYYYIYKAFTSYKKQIKFIYIGNDSFGSNPSLPTKIAEVAQLIEH